MTKVKKLNHRLVYDGRVVTLVVDRIQEPGGLEVEREVVRHSGAAVLLPVTDDGRLVLVRQYRYAVDQHLWEVPAGTIAPGEQPRETARRELVEETGFFPHRLDAPSSSRTVPLFLFCPVCCRYSHRLP